jgi:antitoxin component YwqK of YwqJK toxin-antitoxin module
MKILIFFLFIKSALTQLGPTFIQYNIDSIIQQNNIYVKDFNNELVNGRVFMIIDGQRVHLGNIKDGLKLDKWIDWYKNGLKKEEINYVDGKENGLNINWDLNGDKNYTKYYSSGKKDSLWTFFYKGTKQKEERYKNDILKSIKRFYINGEVMSEGIYLKNKKNNGNFIEFRSRIENLEIIKGPSLVYYNDSEKEKITWFEKEAFNYQNKVKITYSQDCKSNKCLSDSEIKNELERLLKYNEEKLNNEARVYLERKKYLKKIAENKKALIRTKNQIDSLIINGESINNAVLSGINRIAKKMKEDSIKNIKEELSVEKKLLENKFLDLKRRELQKEILLLDFNSYSISYRKIDPLGKNILEIILRNKRDINLQSVNFLINLFKYEEIIFRKEYYFENIKRNEIKTQLINQDIQYDNIQVIPFD